MCGYGRCLIFIAKTMHSGATEAPIDNAGAPFTASFNPGVVADCVTELMKIGAKLESQGLEQKMLPSLRGVTKGIEHKTAPAAPANTTFGPWASAASKGTFPLCYLPSQRQGKGKEGQGNR